MIDYKIHKNNMSHTKGQSYYAVVQNPVVNFYDTKVIWGSSLEIVRKKINRQLNKWQTEEPKV